MADLQWRLNKAGAAPYGYALSAAVAATAAVNDQGFFYVTSGPTTVV